MKNNTRKIEKNQDNFDFLGKFNDKKRKIEIFYEYVKKYKSEVMNMRISDCAGLIGFLKAKDGEKRRLGGGNFCNSRFCPVCDMRKARKDGYVLQFLLGYARKVQKKELIFLTLTAPNVVKEKLKEEIEDFNKSFERLSKTKAFKAICKGYIRKLEVTYNEKEDTYHPHFHVVIAVNKSYFTDTKLYISQKEWLNMWRKAKRNEKITQVDVRKAKMDTMKEVMELATYSAKSADVLHSEKVFDVFYENLKGKKLMVFNGLFKEILKAYKLGELKEYEELDETVYEALEWFKYFDKTGYEIFRIDEVSKERLEKLLIDEIEIE